MTIKEESKNINYIKSDKDGLEDDEFSKREPLLRVSKSKRNKFQTRISNIAAKQIVATMCSFMY